MNRQPYIASQKFYEKIQKVSLSLETPLFIGISSGDTFFESVTFHHFFGGKMNFNIQKTVREPQHSGERADWQKGFWKSKTNCFTLERCVKTLKKYPLLTVKQLVLPK